MDDTLVPTWVATYALRILRNIYFTHILITKSGDIALTTYIDCYTEVID